MYQQKGTLQQNSVIAGENYDLAFNYLDEVFFRQMSQQDRDS